MAPRNFRQGTPFKKLLLGNPLQGILFSTKIRQLLGTFIRERSLGNFYQGTLFKELLIGNVLQGILFSTKFRQLLGTFVRERLLGNFYQGILFKELSLKNVLQGILLSTKIIKDYSIKYDIYNNITTLLYQPLSTIYIYQFLLGLLVLTYQLF